MYYVYILKSEEDVHYYVGYSADLKRRLSEHHQGKVYYTRRYRPWHLVYYEAYLDEVQAKKRERRLKHYGSAYRLLLKRIGSKI